jgi:ElaB/YqjD/DUF883 family membrane-anchored ribosome-binding protein
MDAVTESAANVVNEYIAPISDAINENMREARRAIAAGRQTIEDVATHAIIRVRRHPWRWLSTAIGLGAIAGCVVGFSIGRCRGRRIQVESRRRDVRT